MSAAVKLVVQEIEGVTFARFDEARMLDAVQIDGVGRELFKLVDEMDRKKLVLDFTKVQFLASAALGMLINLQKKSAAIDGTLVICGLRKELLRVFEIMELKPLFTFCTTESEALAALGGTAGG